MPSSRAMPCLGGSQSCFPATLTDLSTKNICSVLGAWEAGKHLVSLAFHSRLNQSAGRGK